MFCALVEIVVVVSSTSVLLVAVSGGVVVHISIEQVHKESWLSLSLLFFFSLLHTCFEFAIVPLSLLSVCIVSSFLVLYPTGIALKFTLAPSSVLVLLQYMSLVCLSCMVSI